MKPAAFEYERPGCVDAALDLLGSSEGARLLAGGQSLVPMMNLRLAAPSALIDIARVPELLAIEDRGDAVFLGAGVTHARLEDGEAGEHWQGLLVRVAREIAYRGVRNRGTIGGSLAHADPAADWPVALAVLGAAVEIAGARERRTLPVDGFARGMFETALGADEMVSGIIVPKLSPSTRCAFIKVRRKRGAFADALAAVAFDRQADTVRVAVGGVATGFARLAPLESADARPPANLAGRIRTTLDRIDPAMDPYLQRLHEVSLARALKEVFA